MRPVSVIVAIVLLVVSLAGLKVYGSYHSRLTHITIGTVPEPYYGLIFIADNQGFFKDEGLDVTMKYYPLGRLAVQDLVDSKVDIATSYIAPFTAQVVAGKPIVTVATLARLQNNFAVMALRSGNISKPDDLTGKRIGLAKNTNSEYFFYYLLSIEGLTGKDFTIVDLQPEELIPALKNGTVDAVSIWQPYLQTAIDLFGEQAIAFSTDFYNDAVILITSKQFTDANPDTVKKMIRALHKAEVYHALHPDDTAQVTAAIATTTPRHIIKSIIDTKNTELVMRLDNRLISLMNQNAKYYLNKTGGNPVPVDFRKHTYTNFLRAVNPEEVTIY